MLEDNEKDIIKNWIRKRIVPANRKNSLQTSYGLKHICEYETGVYCENDEFKALMLECGYTPTDASKLNHTYKIMKVWDARWGKQRGGK